MDIYLMEALHWARNNDDKRILESTEFHKLVMMNMKFRKQPSHFVSFYSGDVKIQPDFVLVRHRDQKLDNNAKVVSA